MEYYYVILNNDGDTTVDQITKQQLLERLEDGYYGAHPEILTEIPKNYDTNYWGESILIIKGRIITPKPVEVITKYNVE